MWITSAQYDCPRGDQSWTGRLSPVVLVLSLLLNTLASQATQAETSHVTRDHCRIKSQSGGDINLRNLDTGNETDRFTTQYAGLSFTFDTCTTNTDPSRHVSDQTLEVTLPLHQWNSRRIVFGSSSKVLNSRFKTKSCREKQTLATSKDEVCPLNELLAIAKHGGQSQINDQTKNHDVTNKITTTSSHLDDVSGEDDDENSEGESGSAEDLAQEISTPGDLQRRFRRRHADKAGPLISPFPDNITAVLRFRSKSQCDGFRSYILLQCDRDLQHPIEAVFKIINAQCPGHLYFIFSHKCCCPGECEYNVTTNAPLSDILRLNANLNSEPKLMKWLQRQGVTDETSYQFKNYSNELNDSKESQTVVSEMVLKEEAPTFMWLIIITNIGVIGIAVCIAAVCCRQGSSMGTTHGPYVYLPDLEKLRGQAFHSSRLTLASSIESFHNAPPMPPKSAEYLDYSSNVVKSNKVPQLSDCVIPFVDVEIGHRLGGGLFGDTYIAEWKDRAVAAKRLIIGVHQGQMDENNRTWIQKEVTFLSHQRHKNVVSVIGVALDTRQPYVICEYVESESLKDQLNKRSEESFSWVRKVKICTQIAEGVAFLHEVKPAIVHRDLRSANVLVDRYDKVKVVDQCMTKLVQRLRQACSGREGCYCQKEKSALPATVRWTAPELLLHPQADEKEHDVITTECDVYSYAMVLWEVASHCDPFGDIPDETEVRELIISGVRPRVDILVGMIPQLRELMVTCWSDSRELRPVFKQIVVHLKSCQQIVTKMSNKPRTRNNSSTIHLKSTLKV